tara:strand:- start:331 stop:549 length:219 start_codon:yes stop_codon:yes gene_type:complete
MLGKKSRLDVFEFIEEDLKLRMHKKIETQFSNCLSTGFTAEKLAEEMIVYKKAMSLIMDNLSSWKKQLKGEH